MIRLFIALNIPDKIKEKITELRKEIISALIQTNIINKDLKWEPEEKLHLTLKFLGDVQEDSLDQIIGTMKFIEDYPKFNCSLTGFGFFFRKNDPKILWAGFSVEKKLFELADRLNHSFINFSILPEQRKFRAHLTLLRIKSRLEPEFIKSFENYKIKEIPFTADIVSLIKSELHPAGSKYTELERFILK